MGNWTRFAVRFAKSRWLVVVAAIWIQCSGGANYSFGIYSQTVKDTFNYDQKSLGTLASWKDVGANLGIVSGLVFDWFSPRGVLAIGALQSGIAYLTLWLAVTGRIATPQFWQMCLYLFLAANAQTFFNTACVVTCVQNFPRNRGVIVGLMKGVLGLSGAILTVLYRGVYGNEPSSYLLMIAWLPSVVTLLLMVIVRRVPALYDHDESRNLSILSAVAVSLAAFLMGIILLESMVYISRSGYVAVCVVMCGILLLPMGVVVNSELQEAESTSFSSIREPLVLKTGIEPSHVSVVPKRTVVEGGGVRQSQQMGISTEGESSTRSAYIDFDPRSCLISPEKGYPVDGQPVIERPDRGANHTIPEAIAKVDFWLLFLAMACGMGSGLTAIDNTGQIGASLGYSPGKVGTFISLFSIWQFLGRLGFGALSEVCLHNYKIGRPVLLASSQICMSLGYVMISSALPGSLYPALVVIGLCYGAQWSLMPAITSELFGLSRFATLFNTISVASPLGAYIFSVQVAGRLYDAEAAKNSHDFHSEDLECYGAHCFRLTFLILAVVSLLGCTACGLLAHRTKSFYARIAQNIMGT